MKRAALYLSALVALLGASPPAAAQTPQTTSPPAVAPASSAQVPEDPAVTARAKVWYDKMRGANLDHSQMTFEISDAFTDPQVKAIAEYIEPLGEPSAFVYGSTTSGDQYSVYEYSLTFAGGYKLCYLFSVDHAGKIAGIYLQQMNY